MTKNWTPTKDSLERLLAWLEPDSQASAQKYEQIRSRLIRYFVSNGCGDNAENLADRAIDRVMRKLDAREVPEPYVGEKALYFLAFANNLRHEHFRERPPNQIPVPVIDYEQLEDEDVCLEQCMERLEQEERWLAIQYYRFEKAAKIEHRRKLAEKIALGLAGLRTRVHRIREELRPCIEECLERSQAH